MSDVENDADIRRSSRSRGKVSKNQNALDALREARKSGKVHRPDVGSLVKNVYEEVDDEEYNAIVRSRQADDFVVDDDGGGYVDHGNDFLDEEDDYEDDIAPKSSRKEKKEKKKKEGRAGTLSSFFGSSTSGSRKVKDESQVKLDDDDLLKNMLADLGDADSEPIETSVSSISTNPFARGAIKRSAPDGECITPRPVTKKVALTSRGTPLQRQEKLNFSSSVVPPKETTSAANNQIKEPKSEPVDDYDNGDFADNYDDDFTKEDSPVAIPAPVLVQNNEIKNEIMEEDQKPVTSVKKEVNVKMLSEASWDNDTEQEAEKVEVVSGAEEFYQNLNNEQFIRMYWLDAYEDPIKHAGTVYLFGRVMTTKTSSASCCLVVKNIQRQIYVLPRQTRVIKGQDTGVVVNDVEVYEEIKDILHKYASVSSFKCKKVAKKFMNNGILNEGEHDAEVDVFEIRYDSTHGKLPTDLSGETFSSIFNITTTSMERLLMEQEIMGPGWLHISNYAQVIAKQTYCDYEFTVDMERMNNIVYNTNDVAAPPLTKMLVINVLTSLNGKDNEICMISTLYSAGCDINSPSTDQKSLQRLCLLCKPTNGTFPFDFKDFLTTRRVTNLVQTTVNEKALLSLFLAKLQKWEPDVIVGHDLQATCELLKARMQKLGVANWSRTSRLKRSAALQTVKNNKAGQWEFTAGRLLVDSKLAAMEMVRSRAYDLTELSSQILNVNRENIYANEIAVKFSSSSQLFNLIQWSWMDPWYSLRVVAQLNALPLYIQITNIVGGVTSRTLMGGRSERNEFLLLHAFHRANVVAPNKFVPTFQNKDKKTVKTEPTEEGEDNEDPNSKKAQYAGGLVLEPKKGLYDTLILLLDFNSLYPSIIQEYNICFTTVKHQKDGNDLPEVPSSSLSEGILPKEIRVLVDRRRQVKNLMKQPNLVESTRKQYDIRQMALKLTANSMYGCLGFKQSRFYAKPLAALVTSKGREILMHTKDLVERLGYSVVYGDTDSIMINTNSVDLQQAKKLGFEIKKQVNQCHRLLELDLDGIFKRMLLLKKKKYAALTVNPDNENETKKELKGLDIVRRDWSQLAKDAGNDIVNLILNPDLTREELVSEIRDSLDMLRRRLDNGKIELPVFQISKQLTRNPKDYSDLKSQPHASVASRLNLSGKFNLKHGDIVEYIICEDGTSNSATQRAYHRTEIEEKPDLKIDLHYYLSQQIHPVVSRLCAPIEETDPVFIAEALGMDSANYRRSAAALSKEHATSEEYDFGPENFDHCDGFSFACPGSCGTVIHVRSALSGEGADIKPSLDVCEKCDYSFSQCWQYLANLLENKLSDLVGQHLSSAFKCDETTCAYRINYHPLKWSREGLDCPKCNDGILRKEFSSRTLFDQQSFYRQIFDLKSSVEKLKPEQKRMMEARYCSLIAKCTDLAAIVNRYLLNNSYNKVDLAFLFAPMLRV